MQRYRTQLLRLLVPVFILAACIKQEEFEVDSEGQSAVDLCIAGQEFSTLPVIIYRMLLKSPGTGAPIPSAAMPMNYVSGDTNLYIVHPKYHAESEAIQSAMSDGKVRTGSIDAEVSSTLRFSGAIVTATLTNYMANGYLYQAAVLSMTTMGETDKYVSINYELKSGTCSQGSVAINLSCSQRIAMYYDGGPMNATGYYSFFGEYAGITRNGLGFTANVERDIIKLDNCPFFAQGTLNLLPKGFKSKKIDFGNGSCDETAQFTTEENTLAFKLK